MYSFGFEKLVVDSNDHSQLSAPHPFPPICHPASRFGPPPTHRNWSSFMSLPKPYAQGQGNPFSSPSSPMLSFHHWQIRKGCHRYTIGQGISWQLVKTSTDSMLVYEIELHQNIHEGFILPIITNSAGKSYVLFSGFFKHFEKLYGN